jgi:hypothetical protein
VAIAGFGNTTEKGGQNTRRRYDVSHRLHQQSVLR